MKKSRELLLIIEPDKQLVTAFKKLVKQMKRKAIIVSNWKSALKILSKKNISATIINDEVMEIDVKAWISIRKRPKRLPPFLVVCGVRGIKKKAAFKSLNITEIELTQLEDLDEFLEKILKGN